jgi:hypothetical protein
MRLFRSYWSYLGWSALFAYYAWRDGHPRQHSPSTPWHPVFFGVEFAIANALCICLVVGATRRTSVAIERAALALLAISLCLSTVRDLQAIGLLHAAIPSFRVIYLELNTLVALLLAIRTLQVLREPPLPGILTRSPTLSE